MPRGTFACLYLCIIYYSVNVLVQPCKCIYRFPHTHKSWLCPHTEMRLNINEYNIHVHVRRSECASNKDLSKNKNKSASARGCKDDSDTCSYIHIYLHQRSCIHQGFAEGQTPASSGGGKDDNGARASTLEGGIDAMLSAEAKAKLKVDDGDDDAAGHAAGVAGRYARVCVFVRNQYRVRACAAP